MALLLPSGRPPLLLLLLFFFIFYASAAADDDVVSETPSSKDDDVLATSEAKASVVQAPSNSADSESDLASGVDPTLLLQGAWERPFVDQKMREARFGSFLAKTPEPAAKAATAPATVQLEEEKSEKEKEEEEDEEAETQTMWILFTLVFLASLYKFILTRGWCSSCLGQMPEQDYVLIGPDDDPDSFQNDPPRPSKPKQKTTLSAPLRPSTGSSGSRSKR
mmetsp:Transcript_95462/g.208761  ORF Transcript_95462/g.208761 Transcript_95462/m.208761 type:complete len:221 (+) Transcript_95462:175-837(+)